MPRGVNGRGQYVQTGRVRQLGERGFDARPGLARALSLEVRQDHAANGVDIGRVEFQGPTEGPSCLAGILLQRVHLAKPRQGHGFLGVLGRHGLELGLSLGKLPSGHEPSGPRQPGVDASRGVLDGVVSKLHGRRRAPARETHFRQSELCRRRSGVEGQDLCEGRSGFVVILAVLGEDAEEVLSRHRLRIGSNRFPRLSEGLVAFAVRQQERALQ